MFNLHMARELVFPISKQSLEKDILLGIVIAYFPCGAKLVIKIIMGFSRIEVCVMPWGTLYDIGRYQKMKFYWIHRKFVIVNRQILQILIILLIAVYHRYALLAL